jgi:hypothetical protein
MDNGIKQQLYAHGVMTQKEAAMFKSNIAMQGAIASYSDSPPETAEYVREFSDDKIFEYDPKTSGLKGGNIPREMKESHWGVNSPNYVFGNIQKEDMTVLMLMEMDIDMAESMYKINDSVLSQRGYDTAYGEAVMAKQAVLNRVNQVVHAYMKKTRALDGKERELMVTKSIVAGTGGEQKKRGGFLTGLMNSVVGRGGD